MRRSLEPIAQAMLMRGVNLRIGKRLARAYYMAERNSRQRGIQFELTVDELARLAQRAKGKCEVTGLPFEVVDTSRKWDRQPWTASIDRIDCTIGYTYANCRVVCAAVNVALNSWGLPVLERIAEALMLRKARGTSGYLLALHQKVKRRKRHDLRHVEGTRSTWNEADQ
jgi:hypothetical protein